jgi:hypothetical protein
MMISVLILLSLLNAAIGIGSVDLDVIAGRVALSARPMARDLPAYDAAVSRNLSFISCSSDSGACNFTDIDYSQNVAANWPALLHPQRALAFAAAFVTPGSAHFNDSLLLSRVHALLVFWADWYPTHKCVNWWHNEVRISSQAGACRDS